MDPDTIGKFIGTVTMLFCIAFPVAVVTSIVYIVASSVTAMAGWVPYLEILMWVSCGLSAPFILMLIYIGIASWWINRN